MRKWDTILEVAERRGNFTRDEKELAYHWHSNPTGMANIKRNKYNRPISQRWEKMAVRFIELVEDEIPDFDEIKRHLTKIKIAIKEVELS